MIKLELNETTKKDRKPWKWTGLKENRAADALVVMHEMKPWWPMTVRQVFYRLISSKLANQKHWYRTYKGKYGPVDIYAAMKTLLKWMRIDERVPWNAITDEHRIITPKLGFTDKMHFINQETDNFLFGYKRCVAQKQANYIEVWIEKAALLHIVKPIADEFCLRTMCCRGYNSVTFQSDFYTRATNAINAGQQPTVLYFGDWDPSGEDMIIAAMQTLIDELDLVGVNYHRAGINPEHFDKIQADPVPIKPSDKRAKKFIAKHGDTAYELDAFHPEELQRLVRESIEAFTDMSAVEENRQKGFDDREVIGELRDDVADFIGDRLFDMGLE